jgi:hypothetical protein
LNGLKSGKDRTRRPWVEFAHSDADARNGIRGMSGFPPRAEPPPDVVSRRRRLGRVREPSLRLARPAAGASVLFGT